MGHLECATPDRVRKLYEQQKLVDGYSRLLQSNISIFGTIDDHDYGCDNSDKNYEHKHETTNAFVDFIGQPKESPMAVRAAAGRGVYGVKLFDFGRPSNDIEVPEWEACIDSDYIKSISAEECVPSYSNKTVAVYVLDVRTNKDPWLRGRRGFESDHQGDFLGRAQWEWFEDTIARSRATVNVVVNGLQVHSRIFPNPNIAESWGSFPYSQRRLLNAMLGPNVQSPMLISGDVHMTQLMRKDCRHRSTLDGKAEVVVQRPLMELTTSGMTHSWGTLDSPRREDTHDGLNKHSTATLRERLNSFVATIFMHTLHQVSPDRKSVV